MLLLGVTLRGTLFGTDVSELLSDMLVQLEDFEPEEEDHVLVIEFVLISSVRCVHSSPHPLVLDFCTIAGAVIGRSCGNSPGIDSFRSVVGFGTTGFVLAMLCSMALGC
jgi:hypothetical protein